MYLLAIDTATNCGGVALARNAEVIGFWTSSNTNQYSERIIDWIDLVLRENGLSLSDIDCFAVSTGPGSFTGIRVGVATVKALSQSRAKPAVGISTLEALAYRFRWCGRSVAPLIDARRQQVFGALYGFEGLKSIELTAPAVARPADWLKALPDEETLFVGDGAEFYREAVRSLRPGDAVFPSDNRVVDSLCRLAYFRFTRGETTDATELRATYIRPPDAEVNKPRASG